MRAQTNFIVVANDIGSSDKALAIEEDSYFSALGVYVLCLGFCDRQRTDGTITESAMRRVVAHRMDVDAELAELVRVGVLERTEDGYRVHGYLEWQRSREEIEAATEQRRQAGLKSAEARRAKSTKTQDIQDKTDKTDRPTDRPSALPSRSNDPLNESFNESFSEPVQGDSAWTVES